MKKIRESKTIFFNIVAAAMAIGLWKVSFIDQPTMAIVVGQSFMGILLRFKTESKIELPFKKHE